jgi:threonine dehydratase
VIAGCPTVAQVREAREAIAGAAIRTPLVRLNASDAPAEIYLKLENLQPIGSFKIRGAANAIAHMSQAQLERGVVTASAGNMAQGVAWRARELGIPCTVIAPDTAPQTKISAIERLGGRILKVSYDEWWHAFEQRSYPGVEGTFIHAFDDLNVMAGNGTIGLEILEDLPDVDAVVIPWGGGGLTCGIASVLRELKPTCKIFAAEVAAAAPLIRCLENWLAAGDRTAAIVRGWNRGQVGLSTDVRKGAAPHRRTAAGPSERSRCGCAANRRTESRHCRRRRSDPGSLCCGGPGRDRKGDLRRFRG